MGLPSTVILESGDDYKASSTPHNRRFVHFAHKPLRRNGKQTGKIFRPTWIKQGEIAADSHFERLKINP
jgi:hypothetical protein